MSALAQHDIHLAYMLIVGLTSNTTNLLLSVLTEMHLSFFATIWQIEEGNKRNNLGAPLLV